MSNNNFTAFSKIFSITLIIISLLLLCKITNVSIQNKYIKDYGIYTAKSNNGRTTVNNPVKENGTADLSTKKLHAKSACLMDSNTHRVLFDKKSDDALANASTTKIMTCIIALENGNKDDIVTISKYASGMPKVKLGMAPQEQYRLGDLLYSLMLESHNDTAVAIAEHIGGSVEGFASLMNTKAAELGCLNTNFVTPNGLDSPEHKTSAKDLCLIASYAIKNTDFVSIINTKNYSFTDISGKIHHTVNNKDSFLTMYNGALGIKTGFTGNAGYCFVGAAERNNQIFISCVLASGWPPDKSFKWNDTTALMNYGFNTYQTINLSCSSINLNPIPLRTNSTKCASQIKALNIDTCETLPKEILYPVKSSDKIVIKRNFPDYITIPISKDDPIGSISIMLNGQTIYEKTITSQVSVANYDYHDIIKLVLKYFLI